MTRPLWKAALALALMLLALAAVGCKPVERQELVLVPVPSTVDSRPGCFGLRGVDTVVLDLLEVEVGEEAELGGTGRIAGLCAACADPSTGVRCHLRQRICRCVDPAAPLLEAAEINEALAGATLDASPEDAITCVRVSALRRSESSTPPAGAAVWDCALSFCSLDVPALPVEGTSFCGLTDAFGPDTPRLEVTPTIFACGDSAACETIERLCADSRLSREPTVMELCADYTDLCGGIGPIPRVDDCASVGG